MSSIPDEKIADFKIGDIFYECECGINIEARVTKEPIEVEGFEGRRAWEWEAVNTQNGKKICYKLTEGYSHYGPRLYTDPEYIQIKNGAWTVELYGAKDE